MINIAEIQPDEGADLCESVTEEEIIGLWRNIKTRSRLSEEEAWQAVVTGIALDMAFSKSSSLKPTTH